MALVVDSSPGSASANSFVSLADAAAYLNGRLNAGAWDAADDDTRARALIEATRELNLLAYRGTRATSTQALAWPRAWAPDPDAPAGALGYYAADVLPRRLQDATIELALQLVAAGTMDLAVADPDAGLVERTVDVITSRWSVYHRPTGLQRFPRVLALLRPLLCGGGTNAPVVRG
jgi:hypothetical protein